jgi:hypothetical protein
VLPSLIILPSYEHISRRRISKLATRKKFDFPVPRELRQSQARIFGIGIEGYNWVIEFVGYNKEKITSIKSFITGDKNDDIESMRKLVESKLSFFFFFFCWLLLLSFL